MTKVGQYASTSSNQSYAFVFQPSEKGVWTKLSKSVHSVYTCSAVCTVHYLAPSWTQFQMFCIFCVKKDQPTTLGIDASC